MDISMKDKSEKKGKNGKIKVSKNGPYLVSGNIPLAEHKMEFDDDGNPCKWLEGKKYPSQETRALCRCGGSKNKPFCDGTHAKTNFDGTEKASKKPYIGQCELIEGPDLLLTDAQHLCASARFCHRAGGTWNLTMQSDDPKAKKIAIEEAGDCPSGRLVAWDKNSGKEIEPELEPSIGVVFDDQSGTIGPLRVCGRIPVESADGTSYEVRNRVTLCRCGKSSNKPFCDSSHLQR
ncbi:Iron-binding zinc finger CDGSH type [uncultured archaeon]|nr:Iron-binding zinc finger CDGSH type [uncultured archaeon]